ncbi:hypothetical protein KFK09_025306 [Dendrobium nobile]|uniref:Uncharacterized protein n=1 Tax=Dendrobium nobile TaxID=94219 RepID=A0A8T3AFS8_DENNO|nr:hypothetical protein KFK09_025306 [Dendrobium nobile]
MTSFLPCYIQGHVLAIKYPAVSSQFSLPESVQLAANIPYPSQKDPLHIESNPRIGPAHCSMLFFDNPLALHIIQACS